MLFDDAVNRRQAQAGAFADFLGGEKRLENPAPDFPAECRSRCR